MPGGKGRQPCSERKSNYSHYIVIMESSECGYKIHEDKTDFTDCPMADGGIAQFNRQ